MTPLRAAAAEPADFFESRIRPVLADTCFKCHGGEKTSHGLRVDSRAALLKGGDSGPALVPGEPDKSLLIQAIRHTHEEIKMPPKKKLPEATVADFVSWVRAGAFWPETAAKPSTFSAKRHWAFAPVREIQPPERGPGGSDHPIDRFILARLRENGIEPAPLADKRTLVRRVYLDLIGLPPTPAEVEAFLNDPAPNAWPNLIERLLASPHYGERWGRHWMDVVRYADTAGDNADYPIPEAHLYRDYIIDSFNADKPYNRFGREQLAGDILAQRGSRERRAEQRVATGFLALSRRYGTGPYELWHLTLENTIETVGYAFLGLNLKCARCHDHKFDPLTMQDYYGLYGIFASTEFPWAGSEEIQSKNFNRQKFVPLLEPDEATHKLQSWQDRLKALRAEVERLEKEKEAAEKHKHRLDAVKKELRNLEKPGVPPDLPAAYAVQEGKPADVPVHLRGEPADKGPVVPRCAPKCLAGEASLNIPAGASGRLEFANWLTQPDHPLTARVMVNRIWQHHFDKGLVATPNNFGLRGEEPTHPELLDYLARRLVESGWSIKAMHRLILTSRTWQQASGPSVPSPPSRSVRALRFVEEQPALHTEDWIRNTARAASIDPGNTLYWRFDRRRLEAEALRDAMMYASGELDLRRPGPHPFPPPEKWTWTQHTPFKDRYETKHRSVYLMTQRFQRHPFLALFDGPDTNNSTEARRSSIVPQQALFALNNPFVDEQARRLAGRVLAARSEEAERIRLAQELAWSRPPSREELVRWRDWLEQARKLLAGSDTSTDQSDEQAWNSLARVLLSANEFVYVD
jgi:hypothetical protein